MSNTILDFDLTTHQGLAAVGATFAIINLIVIVARFYARRRQGGVYGADDWVMISAYLCFIGMTATTWWAIKYHYYGYAAPDHPSEVGESKHRLVKMFFAFDIFAVLSMGLTKISALFFFKRVFFTGHKMEVFNYIIIGGIGVIVLWMIAFLIMSFFECGTHISAEWTSSAAIAAKYCTHNYPVLEGLAISDFLLDFFVLLLPIPKIMLLHTTLGRRFAIVGVFLLAFVGLAASILRVAFIYHLLAGKSYKGPTTSKADGFIINTEMAFIYVLEGGFTILAASLPSLWYFSSKIKPESVLRSIRSIVSLKSTTSQRSGVTGYKGSSKGGAFEEDSRKSVSNSTSSRSGLTPSDRGRVETIALSDIEPQDLELGYNAADEIKVTQSVKQRVQNK